MGDGAWLFRVLGEGKRKRCQFVKWSLEINSSHFSNSTLTGKKKQSFRVTIWASFPGSLITHVGFFCWRFFSFLGLLPCLTAPNALVLRTHLFHQLLLQKDFMGSICLSKLLIWFCFLFRDFICKTGMCVHKIR